MMGCAHLLPAAVAVLSSSSQENMPPHTLLWDGEFLLRTRAASSTNPATAAAVTALRSVASVHVHDGPFSVLDKGFVPPSGDKRDFMTLSAYYWPCNETCSKSLAPNGDCSRFCSGSNNNCNYTAIPSGCPNSKSWCNNGPHVYGKNGTGGDCSCPACDEATGIPWAAHDGYNWPHATDDRGEVDKLWGAVVPLTLAWYYSGEKTFLDRAVVLLRAWFTSPITGMRPNLRFADTIPGVGAECGGTVNFARFGRALDCILLIEHGDSEAQTWTATDRRTMRAFVSQFLEWWLYSRAGSCVRETKANIGMAYEINALTMALFVNDSALARSIANNHTATRLNTQINGSGVPILDAPRPDGFGYGEFCVRRRGIMVSYNTSTMNVAVSESLFDAAAGDFMGLMDLARVALLAGGSIDLYTYVNTTTGASLAAVGQFFEPFCSAKCNTTLGHDAMAKCIGWPFHQVKVESPQRY